MPGGVGGRGLAPLRPDRTIPTILAVPRHLIGAARLGEVVIMVLVATSVVMEREQGTILLHPAPTALKWKNPPILIS